MSSVPVLTHLLSLLFKEALHHAQPNAVAGDVSNSAAELQTSLMTITGSRGAPRSLKIGVELSLLLCTLWLIVGLFLSQRCTIRHTGTCPALSPRHCALPRLHCSNKQREEPPQRHITLIFDGGRSRQQDLHTTLITPEKQCVVFQMGFSDSFGRHTLIPHNVIIIIIINNYAAYFLFLENV